ncbi:uracil-DNA glycosylase family protein [Miltoncostaea marina]|uniref:uracil-DNA glycosylase family protein n=1 Tax=Miltoncostaea marina TaxID=2843215 RepID=UPI001C3DA836|nr:uracil-DNA glycosylase family protein [Miltoncostaea marina]
MAEPRRYRFGPLEPGGALGFMSWGQLGWLASGGVAAVVVLRMVGGARGGLIALALAGGSAALAFAPAGGRSLSAWAPVAGGFLRRRLVGEARYRAEGPQSGLPGGCDLPPALSQIRIIAAPVVASRDVAHQPVGNVMTGILDGSPGGCERVILAQWERSCPREEVARRWRTEHQLPEPWSGDLARARVLFVSSNPSGRSWRLGTRIGVPGPPAAFADPAHPSRRHGGAFPRAGWRDDEIADYFNARLELTVNPRGFHRMPDGSRGPYQRFWGWAAGRVRELIPDGSLARDACMTELVRCKSIREEGVDGALATCTSRYLEPTLRLSPARVVIAVGKKARSQLSVSLGELSEPRMVAGLQRVIIGLAHPSSAESPKRISQAGTADQRQYAAALAQEGVSELDEQ